jgi:hypothetical protein
MAAKPAQTRDTTDYYEFRDVGGRPLLLSQFSQLYFGFV